MQHLLLHLLVQFIYNKMLPLLLRYVLGSATNTTSLRSRNMSTESDTNTAMLGLTETNYSYLRYELL